MDSKTRFMSISYFGLKCKRFFFSMCQICAAVAALRNINSLLWPSSKKPAKALTLDILDWLQAMFGFQVIFLIDILSSNICHECLTCCSNVRIPLSCRKIMQPIKGSTLFYCLPIYMCGFVPNLLSTIRYLMNSSQFLLFTKYLQQVSMDQFLTSYL